MRIDNPSISGSLSFIGGNNSISATSVNLTGSFSGSVVGTFEGGFSSAATTEISGAFDSVSSSLASRIASQEGFSSSLDSTFATDAQVSTAVSSLNAATSSYLQNTTDTLTGDLTVTGTITAQEFHTEFVSASIIYQSGSTQFGNSSDDTHIFRGELFVSASDVEDILTSKNYSAAGAPEQFQIRHSNGNDIIESKRGSLTLAGDGIYLSGSNTYLYNKLIDTSFVSSFVDFSDNGNTVVSSNNDTVLGYLQNNYVKQSGTVGLGVSTPSSGVRLQATGKTSSGGAIAIAPAGTAVSSSVALFTNGDPNYGTLFGTLNTGHGWIQQQRVDGTATTYNLLLQPNGGSIGIGTTSPAYKLQVSGVQNANDIVINNTTTGVNLRLQMIDAYGFMFTTDSKDLLLGTNNTESMRINSSGNVGIGTNSPEEILDVSGSVLINNNEFYKVESTAGTNYKIAGLTSGNVIQVGAIDYTSAATTFAGGDSVSITTGGASGTTRMYISGSGNVGIGISSPSTKLNLVQGSNIRVNSDSTDPSTFLDYYYNASYNHGLAVEGDRGLRMFSQTGDTSAKLTFYTEGQERMRIDSSGRVGINTAPSLSGVRLHTYNNSTDAYNIFESSTNKWVFGEAGGVCQIGGRYGHHSGINVDTAGNVGIGLASPLAKLDIVKAGNSAGGNIMLSGNKTDDTAKYGSLSFAQYDSGGEPEGFTGILAYSGQNENTISIGGGIYEQNAATNINFYTYSSTVKPYGTSGNLAISIDSNPNIGIGTTAPSEKLHILGGKVRLHHQANGYGWIYAEDENHSLIMRANRAGTVGNYTHYHQYGGDYSAGGGHHFWTGGTLLNQSLRFSIANDYTVFQNTSVGIGVTSPSEKLHVEGRIRLGTTPVITSHDDITIDIDQNNNQADRYFRVTKDGESSELFRVQENGSVGIGTNVPDALLDVYATSRYGSAVAFNIPVNSGSTADTDYSFGSNYNQARHHFRGSHEILLGRFTLRDGSRYLDVKTNINSNGYMFGARAIGYLYSRGIIDSQCAGYSYTSNSVIQKFSYQSGTSNVTIDSYRASGGELCFRIDSVYNGYSEGALYIYFYGHGNSNGVQINNYIQNDSSTNYYA